jgi:hypothetical protein
MRVLLITPPLTQVNTPYPATPFLTGFLRSRGIEAEQADLGIELCLHLLSRKGLDTLLPQLRAGASPAAAHLSACADRCIAAIDPVIAFLQDRNPSAARRIARRAWLPEGPRFAPLNAAGDDPRHPMTRAFGALKERDRARHLASLFIGDLVDGIRDGLDAHFELARYAERLALSAPSAAAIFDALDAPPTPVAAALDELAARLCASRRPDLIAITSPFPGNVYGAFRIARAARRAAPGAKIAWGGGYPSTELRELSDPRVFDFFDFVCLDDGERALWCLIEHLAGRRAVARLANTFVRIKGRVSFKNNPGMPPIAHAATGIPTYDGLPMDGYFSMFELLNPMHRLWSDGRWNKLMVAHGCYWRQCSFCDTSLNYIRRYSAASADLLVDRMEALIRETGQTGFHFVDEAAPPAALEALSRRLIERSVRAQWWGNIRFEKSFTPERCELMAKAGCIAVSGGLEVAEARLLRLMRKGVTVEQVARVTRHFSDAGIMVHAYLMYGFPTQTPLETVNALEYVRQLFAAGCIQSGFWHRFALTVHSPIFADPRAYGIRIRRAPPATFARNEAPYDDPAAGDLEMLGRGLRKALYNFMYGAGLDADARGWFDAGVPESTVPPDAIARALKSK